MEGFIGLYMDEQEPEQPATVLKKIKKYLKNFFGKPVYTIEIKHKEDEDNIILPISLCGSASAVKYECSYEGEK